MQEVLSMFQITDFQFFQHLPFAINCDGNGKAVLGCRASLGIAFKVRTEKLQDCFWLFGWRVTSEAQLARFWSRVIHGHDSEVSLSVCLSFQSFHFVGSRRIILDKIFSQLSKQFITRYDVSPGTSGTPRSKQAIPYHPQLYF